MKTKTKAKTSAKKRSVSEASKNLKAAKKAARKSAAPPSKKKAVANARTGVKEGSKLAIVAGLLTRPEGCTGAEILAATKWPTVSVPQQAKAAGLILSKEKDGGVTRYRGAPAASAE